MESKKQPEQQQSQDGAGAATGQNKLDEMEFDLDDHLLKVQKSNHEMDHELLQIQRRKSAPKVVIEEFVQVDSDDEEKQKEDKDEEEHKVSDDVWNENEQLQVSKKPHIVKKHIEIEDVSVNRSYLFQEFFAERGT